MQALGLIETKGLIAAVVSADAMLKAADVNLLQKTYVGGGLVSIAVTGDVGAVKAAVEAGSASVKTINDLLLISQHVIPRPHEGLDNTIISSVPLNDRQISTEVKVEENEELKLKMNIVETPVEDKEAVEEVDEDLKIEDVADQKSVSQEKVTSEKVEFKKPHTKKNMDDLVFKYGLEESVEFLNKLKVTELRNLARKYNDFGIKGREISKAGKELLLTEFKKYYESN